MAHYHFGEQSISDSTDNYQVVYLYDNIRPFPPDYYVREENFLKSFYHNLLSQEDIRVISRKYPTERITHELVEAAITNMARRARGADERHYSGVNAGKDNATAAMYARR